MNEQLVAGALSGFALGAARLLLSAVQLIRTKVEEPKWGQLVVAHVLAIIIFAVMGGLVAFFVTGPVGTFATSLAALFGVSSLGAAALGNRATKQDASSAEQDSDELRAYLAQLQKDAFEAQKPVELNQDQFLAACAMLSAQTDRSAKQSRRSALLYFVAGILAALTIALFVRPIT